MADLRDGIPSIPYPSYRDLPEEIELREFRENILYPLNRKLREVERDEELARGEYDSTLLEKIAGEGDPLYDREGSVRVRIESTGTKVADIRADIERGKVQEEELEEKAKNARKPIMDEYKWAVRMRQSKVFAWEAVFWIPFFCFALWWHTRTRRKESKWEMVSLSVYAAAGIIAIQSFGVFLWSWIPKQFLEWLWELLQATLLTRVIGYYVMIGLFVVLFGGLIVFIHRRITDPVRGGMKKIRHGLCPQCSYPLNLSEAYCGGCGKELKKKCNSCKEEGYEWQAKCVHCGKW